MDIIIHERSKTLVVSSLTSVSQQRCCLGGSSSKHSTETAQQDTERSFKSCAACSVILQQLTPHGYEIRPTERPMLLCGIRLYPPLCVVSGQNHGEDVEHHSRQRVDHTSHGDVTHLSQIVQSDTSRSFSSAEFLLDSKLME
jgi:hypothetical protein